MTDDTPDTPDPGALMPARLGEFSQDVADLCLSPPGHLPVTHPADGYPGRELAGHRRADPVAVAARWRGALDCLAEAVADARARLDAVD